ncbi:hypothetical protein L6164_033350 [Bauhinia variegata]|uniref:Uncharacterized protein n=1 Tax=Bauhinia variegata TaxID=167791 RepID=A0ACB9KS55_BAUVA|nr:hypothetical protein L6164_033350 [Bauhinia variegata]
MNLEDAMAKLAASEADLTEKTNQFMVTTNASIKQLENQVGQISQLLTTRQPGALPSTTEANPRDVKAITLRSGKTLEVVQEPTLEGEKEVEKAHENTPEERPKSQESVHKLRSKLFPYNTPPYKPPLPFPNRFRKQKLEKQFAKFLELCEIYERHIIQQEKLQDYETVALTEECNAILQKKLPQKLKDPRNFTIPCVIGQEYFSKALCDLRASINLMPLSIYRKLNNGEAKPTTVSLQLADRSIKYPRGIVEDVLVKVDKFIFLADFIVLDMEEDQEIPIILGRPFLATERALIDVQKGNLTFRV